MGFLPNVAAISLKTVWDASAWVTSSKSINVSFGSLDGHPTLRQLAFQKSRVHGSTILQCVYQPLKSQETGALHQYSLHPSPSLTNLRMTVSTFGWWGAIILEKLQRKEKKKGKMHLTQRSLMKQRHSDAPQKCGVGMNSERVHWELQWASAFGKQKQNFSQITCRKWMSLESL